MYIYIYIINMNAQGVPNIEDVLLRGIICIENITQHVHTFYFSLAASRKPHIYIYTHMHIYIYTYAYTHTCIDIKIHGTPKMLRYAT